MTTTPTASPKRFVEGERVRRTGRIMPYVRTREGTVISTQLQERLGTVRVFWDCPDGMKRRSYRNSVSITRLESLGAVVSFDRRLAERP